MGLWRIGESRISPVEPCFTFQMQKSRYTLSAEEEMKEIKEKFNDARSKFMVRFLYQDTILSNDHSLSLLANFFNPCSRCPRHSRPCQRQDRRASAPCRLFIRFWFIRVWCLFAGSNCQEIAVHWGDTRSPRHPASQVRLERAKKARIPWRDTERSIKRD